MNNIPAITGWNWLKEGIGLFRKQPAALTTLLFANILISRLLSGMVPPLGAFLAVVLIPSFSMAFMKACLMIENGERVTPVVLLTGFRMPVFPQLCKIGLVYLMVSALLSVLAFFVLDVELIRQIVQSADPKNIPQLPPRESAKILAILSLNAGVLIALSFAGPLLYWQQMQPGKAMFYSFFAVWRSARVFLVLLLAWFGLFMLFSIVVSQLMGATFLGLVLTMWLLFLFMLLLQCSMYAAYRQIFGKPAESGAQGVSLEKR